MATLHVRNVPDALYEALRMRAESQGRSIGGETIAVLSEAVSPTVVREGRRFRRARRQTAGPFERFGQPGKNVLVRAQEEAKGLGHNYIGTEHILLGLFADARLAEMLGSLGVRPDNSREAVARIIGRGEELEAGAMRFTPRAKKVLELSLREALALEEAVIEARHILLGLLREGEGVAVQVLRELGAPPDKVKGAVVLMQLAPVAPEVPEYRAVSLAGSADEWSEQLNALATDGWELFSLASVGREHRAVMRRGAQ